LVGAGVVSWKIERARTPEHYALAGLLQGVLSDSLLLEIHLLKKHLYDVQLPAFPLPCLQEGIMEQPAYDWYAKTQSTERLEAVHLRPGKNMKSLAGARLAKPFS
jgi:hypothetical protein